MFAHIWVRKYSVSINGCDLLIQDIKIQIELVFLGQSNYNQSLTLVSSYLIKISGYFAG